MTIATLANPGTTAMVRPSQLGTLVLDDGALVQLCLNGDASAWAVLYGTQYPDLMKYVERHWPDTCRHSLADDVVTHVLRSLPNRNFARLRKFDPDQGCLLFHLQKLVRGRMHEQLRKRPRKVKLVPLVPVIDPQAGIFPLETMLAELLPKLTEEARQLCLECLQRSSGEPLSARLRPSALSKLRGRLHRELLQAMEGDPHLASDE